jgi:hypothetical protein
VCNEIQDGLLNVWLHQVEMPYKEMQYYVYLDVQLKKGKQGRGSENKQPFIAAVELNEKGKPIHVKLTPVKSFTKTEIEKWPTDNLTTDCSIKTDGLPCFNAFSNFSRIKQIKVVMKEDPKTGEKSYFP